MSQILFKRKASTLDEIDRAFVKTALAATLGVVVIYQMISRYGIDLSSWNMVWFVFSIPATFIFVFLIAESQKNSLYFFLEGEELRMEYEKPNGELICLTNVKLEYWWTIRGGGHSDGTDLYILVEGETGEQVMLRDALMLPGESCPKDWSYSHLPVTTDVFRLETSKLGELTKALSMKHKR